MKGSKDGDDDRGNKERETGQRNGGGKRRGAVGKVEWKSEKLIVCVVYKTNFSSRKQNKKEKKQQKKKKRKRKEEEKKEKEKKKYLDLNTVEVLTVVHTNNAPNHLRDNDHVPKVGLDTSRALTNSSLTLGLTKTLQEGHMLPLHATVGESPAGTSREQVNELGIGQVEKFLEVNATVGKFTESPLLGSLEGGGR